MNVFQKKNKSYKWLAILLTIMMLVTPTFILEGTASAASSPKLERLYTYSYAGTLNTYKMLSVKRGYTIQWSISKEAAGYVSFSTTNPSLTEKTTVATGNTSTIRVYTSTKATEKLGTKYKITATVFNEKGKKIITRSDSVKLSVDAKEVTIKNAPPEYTMTLGETFNFDRLLTPEKSTNKTFWTVSNELGCVLVNTKTGLTSRRVAMTRNGIFKPKAVGTFTITANVYRSKNASVLRATSKPVVIKVIPAGSPTIAPAPTVTPTPTPIPTAIPEPTAQPTLAPSISPSPSTSPSVAPEEISITIDKYVVGEVFVEFDETVSLYGRVDTNSSVASITATCTSDDEEEMSIAVEGTEQFAMYNIPLALGSNVITVTAETVNGLTTSIDVLVNRVEPVFTTFSGTIYAYDDDEDSTNNPPLQGAKIVLQRHNTFTLNNGFYEAISNEDGSYSFDNVATGSYKVEVGRIGYITYIDNNYVVEASETGIIQDFYLATRSANLSGIVTIADQDTNINNNVPLQNINISLTKLDGSLTSPITVSTDTNGRYLFENIPLGLYQISVSDDNYIPVTSQILIDVANTTTYNITLEAISNQYTGEGIAQGTIINALTGSGVEEGLTLTVRRGYNVRAGEVVTTTATDHDGKYSLTLPAGNYTVYIEDLREEVTSKYRDGSFNIKVLGGITIGNQNGSVTPILNANEIRIVLTWGSDPEDLDSHLTGPTRDGGRYHIYYSYDSYYEDDLIAQLDVDDVDSYGPETITVYSPEAGIYKYSVHDYTNRNLDYSTSLANSGASVQLFIGESSYTYYVPNLPGTVWDVFEYNSTTGQLTILNTMSYNSSPSTVARLITPNSTLFSFLSWNEDAVREEEFEDVAK